jgi:putative ABC transport system permease protein
MTDILRDINIGIRTLIRARSFTLLAIGMLAIALGATTSIFSVINGILLRPLPYAEPDSLIWITSGSATGDGSESSYPNAIDLARRTATLTDVTVYANGRGFLYLGDEPLLINGVNAGAALFPLLRARPVLGRVYGAADDLPKAAPVMVISYELFQHRFGGDPRTIGSSVRFGSAGKPRTIIGVMPPGFDFPVGKHMDYWAPLEPALDDSSRQARGANFLDVIGRLKPGVTLQSAQADTTRVSLLLEQQYKEADTGVRFHLVGLHEYLVRPVRAALLLLFAAVIGVLLIGCANVANLLLARAAGRSREIAIRTAVGATRGRIVTQLLIESVLLSLMAGTVGLLLASWGVRALIAFAPARIPRIDTIGIDGRVLLFALLASLLTGIGFGLAPALAASKTNLNESLKEGGRGTTDGRRGNRMRNALVVSEMALSLMLLVGAGLLLRSFVRITSTDPGYDHRNLATMRLGARASAYDTDEKIAGFHARLQRQLAAIPGATAVSGIDMLPLSRGENTFTFHVVGQPPFPLGQEPDATTSEVLPGFFAAMKIPLLQGRDFTVHDTLKTTHAVIVTERFAKQYLPKNQNPIGMRLEVGDGVDQPREIIGVAADIRFLDLSEAPKPALYVSELQHPASGVSYVVRSSLPPSTLLPALRAAVKAVDPEQPIVSVGMFAEMRAGSLATRRFNLVMLTILAIVALLLAAAGIYSIMSYNVTQRTSEIGVRMALGAEARDIFRLIVGRALRLSGLGIVIGAIAALLASRLMSSLLYGIAPTDPPTFIAICLVLGGVALLASYIPARRAAKVDPLVAIRYD